MDAQLYRQLPKVELHCHLDGSLSLGCIRQLAKLAQVKLPSEDRALKALVTAPATAESLMDYLKAFDVIRPLLQTQEALALAAYDVARQAAKEHVLYLEMRFAPELSMDQGLTVSEIMEAVFEGTQKAQEEYGILVKIIVCGMRQSPLARSKSIFEQAIAFAQKGLVGFDFAGNELDFPPSYLAAIIEETKSLGLPFTLHAGECGCPNYIGDAIALGVKRLGHATALSKQPDLLEDMRKQDITAELCLSSNLQTKAAPSIGAFPYQLLKTAGLPISINTDNRTVSDTSLTKEYQLYAAYFDTSLADFYQHNQDALKASFASKAEKAKILQRLSAAYQPYLNQ
ncbi:adenosine deaminase [Streptococcus halichoeri]|uniref:adenosine deaminase n=1 Tax=Streptococcus halichoeri TaxID=254785 RepID=UPI000DB71E4D|nr:adenosine deaminase [Streptococcus halichoeri]PZO94146.1 MAG: adenosine deaminase [Streptococcus pyogenes]